MSNSLRQEAQANLYRNLAQDYQQQASQRAEQEAQLASFRQDLDQGLISRVNEAPNATSNITPEGFWNTVNGALAHTSRGLSEGLYGMNPFTGGVDLAHGLGNYVAEKLGHPNAFGASPIGGSEWMNKYINPVSDPGAPTTLTDQMSRKAGEFSGMFAAGGVGGAMIPNMGMKTQVLRQVLGDQPLGELAAAGLASGAGAALGGHYGGPAGEILGMFGGPAAVTMGTRSLLGMTSGIANDLRLASLQKQLSGLAPPETELGLFNLNRLFGGGGNAQGGSPTTSWWDKAIGQPISNLGQKIGELPIIPHDLRLARTLGGNTLSDWFVHPMDRMQGKQGELFAKTGAETSRVSKALGSVAQATTHMNLDERDAIRTAMKHMNTRSRSGTILPLGKIDPQYHQLVVDTMAPVVDALTVSRGQIFPEAKMRNIVQRTLHKGMLNVFAEKNSEPLWQMVKKNYTGDLTTPEGTQKFLDTMISDPTTPDVIRNLALEYYNIGSKTAGEVAAKFKGAFEKQLVARLVQDPNAVRPITPQQNAAWVNNVLQGGTPQAPTLVGRVKNAMVQPEWQAVHGHDELEGMLVHRNVAEGIRDLDTSQSVARTMYNQFFLNPWKTMKIMLNPAARIRDAVSNVIFNDVGGMHPLSPMRGDVYLRALSDIRGKSAEFQQFMTHVGGDVDSLISVNTAPLMSALRHGAGVPETLLRTLYDPNMKILGMPNVLGKTTNAMGNATNFIDLWTKFAKYQWNIAHGMPSYEASVDALRTIGDHMRQTRATKLVRDWAMPFFGWQVHAIRTMSAGVVHHPVRTAKYLAIPLAMQQYAVQKLDIKDNEFEWIKNNLPEFMKSTPLGLPTQVPLPVRDSKGRLQFVDISWWIPGLQDMGEIGRNSSTLTGFIQNPLWSISASLRDNKKFSGAPIWNEWESGATKTAKVFAYIGEQMMPSWMPGVGSTWNKFYDAAYTNKPDRMTVPQSLGWLVGARTTPIDPGMQAEKHTNMLNAYMRSAEKSLEKDMVSAKSISKQRRVMKKYQRVFKDIAEQYNPH